MSVMGKWNSNHLNQDRKATGKLPTVLLVLLLLTVGSIAAVLMLSWDNPLRKIDDPQSRAPRLFLNATEGDDHIQLTWNSIPSDSEFGFTLFKIYRAYDGQNYTLIDSVEINQTSYADHAVARYRTCWYLIHATPDQKFQNPSDSNFVWVECQSNWTSLGKRASSAPLGLAIRPMDGKVSLTWNAPMEDGGHWVTSYSIYRGTSSENLRLVGNFGANSIYYDEDYRDLGLTNHLTYYYAVSANNTLAESNRSDLISVTPLPAPQLSAKRISPETYSYFSNQILQVNWSMDQDPMLTVVGYKLYLQQTNDHNDLFLVGAYNASGPFASLINMTYPHASGILVMAVEYQDHNISYSEPVLAILQWSIDGPIGLDWSVFLIILILAIGIPIGIVAVLWKRWK
jgi:hypothetical protein